MARKNGMTGSIPGAGRPMNENVTVILNVRISKDARAVIDTLPRMQRGKYISELILKNQK